MIFCAVLLYVKLFEKLILNKFYNIDKQFLGEVAI